ncbi:stabilin-2 isoform X2 [Pygocentrus nattereri]|uniref:stabilin-2 isoform X2 n=1 Tax=Pygocentrus nattereri TaxID=42514 RepID=UPI0008147D44|nr:stabilin-2 isoform X2 [Pygocentrus nattereri]
MNAVCGTELLLLLIFIGTEINSAAAQNHCDKNIEVTTKTDCHSCSISSVVNCPEGYQKKTPGRGKQDCRYNLKTISNLSIPGCSHECYKEEVEQRCCPGYWGIDCIECPGSAATPCNRKGVCSDGMGGNGTCTCKAGFVGTACEECDENLYGPMCSTVCTCKHGLCNSGLKGNGQCTCFSGYTGPDCDQELPGCAALRCGPDALCFEDVSSGKLACKCKSGYAGDGVQCTSINPCVRSVCHQHAVCVHTGPNQHTCTCTEGYQGDGLVCLPIDPCQTNFGSCQSHSTRCVYDGPGKAHCECLPGFEKLVMGVGCSLRDACKPDSCHKNAYCTNVAPGTVECTCRQGFLGNGKICFGNIMQRLQDLNSEPGSGWTGQLSNGIRLFEAAMSWPLTSLGPFTVFVPSNKALKSTSVKTLVADEAKARYLVKMHMVAGEVTSDFLKKGILYYTLTGKLAESITESQQVKIRIHGSRRKGTLVESDVIASNGIIHIIDKMMDTVPSTVISDNQENLMKILSDNSKFSQFKSLFEKTTMADTLDQAGPYTVFAPTNTAFSLLKDGYLDYLTSEEGKPKLLELLRNHIVASAQLRASYIVSNPRTESMANQVLEFNVTTAGQILINGIAVVEADVEAKNGRLYSLDGVLIPQSIEPILPHRCDTTDKYIYKAPCVSCRFVSLSTCPTGASLNTFSRGCIYTQKTLGMKVPVLGCSLFCNETRVTPKCCEGFFGQDCSPCPGGFSTPCSSHGKCFDGINGNGTCQCEPNFKGSRCQYCADPNKYGPSCDQTCGCVQGVCDNRPEAHGTCKPGSCEPGFAGQLCDKHAQPCGPNQPCHAHANCVYSEGALTCVCKHGFQGDGFLCAEVDACASPPNGGCSKNANCIKTGPGTHRCECVKGWREDGDECQPVNNCLEPSRGGCHPNASCIHVGPGQNYCVCKQNYRGNGRECEAVNECVEQIGGCHPRALCLSVSQRRFQCVCQPGYLGDGSVCYGTLAQEVESNPDLNEFNTWVNQADLTQLLSETHNLTLFVPSAQAISNLSKEDQDFWLSSSNLPSLVKSHIVSGLFGLSDLRSSPSPQITSLLKRTLPVSWTNETTTVAGAAVLSGDMLAKNGLIHLINTVLVSDRKLSEGLLEVLNQRPEFSLFMSSLTNYNLTETIEEASGFTVFAPTNTAITEYLQSTGQDSLDVNVTKYHIVLGETLKQGDLQDGLYKDTMLGFSYQLGIFRNDSNWCVNKAQLSATDIESTKGVVHGLSAVLKIPNNRCDTASSKIIRGQCMDCFYPGERRCPPGTEEVKTIITKRKCTYSRRKHGMFIGCQASCRKLTIKRKCCEGFYGTNCENCPGPEGQPCFSNGVCMDGINGTGVCQCNPGFNGTACETCQIGKYGIHCDQDCKCVNGWCNDGLEGDGTCQCEVGWRGVSCSVAITTDSCGGKCHTSANCLLKVENQSYYCSCAAGYQGNGTYCTAVNACEKDNGGCSYNAVCKRTLPGRRQCVCNPGFAGDGKVCVSINPCLDDNGGCSANSDCIHTGPNKTSCVCKPDYSGDGKTCSPVNLCSKKNGGCHKHATCTMTGPGERNCSCPRDFIGDGITCKDNVMQELRNRGLTDFFYNLLRADISFLQGRGPYTMFAPNKLAFNKPEYEKPDTKEGRAALMMYHIVSCQSLLPEDLTQPRNLTTLTGEVLTISYSKGTVYINNKVKVVYSDQESSNGIFHEIDTVLTPPSFQKLSPVDRTTTPTLKDIANTHGFKTFIKLLEDTEVMKKVMDPLHLPVTLFLPTDLTMAALPQQQKDFLYGLHNRAQLIEYLEYHILRDMKVQSAEVIHLNSLKTLQGSEISVSCVGEKQIGELYINDKSCRIVKRSLNFPGGTVFGIDCLLTPPSLGGRCDHKDVVDITMPCRRCSLSLSSDCPAVSKPKTVEKCDLPRRLLAVNTGCQSVCSMVIWKPKCCSGYYGRDCLACPGGPGSPCSNHGQCDEDHLGNGTCTCNTGFQGVACELCTEGHFGPDCKACNCTEHGMCDEGPEGTGSCFCNEGWTGPRCEHKLADGPLCVPACHKKAVCAENNTCVCKPFYEGDGITCKVTDLCQFWNGGCAKNAECSQKEEKVNCTCLKGYSGDGLVCSPVDPCVVEDNGGCHEHAICTMTGAGKRKCECKPNYVGDGLMCELKVLPVNRCMQDNGQCHSDAQCTDMHYQDKTVGVFHYRSPLGTYKLNYTQAEEACRHEGGTMATYIQLSYAQQAGYSMCSAGWLAEKRVGYPMSFSNAKCGFGHVGIVDYGTQKDLSKTWDTFCYRIKDMKCECKVGYIGDGYSCTGNLYQVLSTKPDFSNFLSQILNYSKASAAGQEFVKRLTNISIQSTLFVPDNNGLYENETLSYRDIEHHLLDGRALMLQGLINVTHVRTRLGHTLNVKGVASLQDPQTQASSGYINDRYIIEPDILTSNGIIHVLQGPLKAPPPPPPSLPQAHKAGMGIGILLLVILIVAAVFVGYHFYNQQSKPFQFHYFKEDEREDTSPSDSTPYICNPTYEATPAPSSTEPPMENKEDKHQVVSGGSYDLLQDS